ncbi:MAG: ParA family protein [Acidithiobacillus sp.]|nr:ParA family protein [Acidithiobacillus sp.]
MATPRQIALFNAKGGCGKTTLAWNLAMGLGRRGPSRLVDADPQGSLGRWADWALESGESIEIRGLEALESQVSAGIHYVIIDCPPALESKATVKALEQADWVLLPVLPSPLDLWASQASIALIQELRERRPQLQAAFVLNQVEGRSALSRAAEHAIAGLGLPVLSTHIARRAIYRSAAVEGKSVYQMGKRGYPAVAEMESLIKEVLQ